MDNGKWENRLPSGLKSILTATIKRDPFSDGSRFIVVNVLSSIRSMLEVKCVLNIL